MNNEMLFLEVTIIISRILIEAIFFLIGISVFSFLNVVIYRLPRKLQFTLGKSMCTSCHHELAPKDLIPLFSWISLRGKCRYCGAKISARYTIVEALGGISAVACTMIFGIKPKALVVFILSGIVVTAIYIVYDMVHKRLT